MIPKEEVYKTLQQLGIAYDSFAHKAAYTMDDCDQVDEQFAIDANHCKNLFLCNRQKTEFFILLIGAHKRFRTADVSKKIGKSRLSFGEEDKLWQMLQCKPGSISPMGLIFDPKHQVNVIIDSDLKEGKLCFHPCDNTESLIMDAGDFYGVFLPHTGHQPVFVEIESSAE
jgi:Ala-tRNA(Pro) deacylase